MKMNGKVDTLHYIIVSFVHFKFYIKYNKMYVPELLPFAHNKKYARTLHISLCYIKYTKVMYCIVISDLIIFTGVSTFK